MLKISPQELKTIFDYIYSISGIHLDNSKTYLLETRLSSVARDHGCNNYWELYKKSIRDTTKRVERAIISAITTNETLFFRDKKPFELLRQHILPEIIANRGNSRSAIKPNLRIWSAASSTGQELYSVAIIIKEMAAHLANYNISLLGTDISDSAIDQATIGKYNKFEIERGLESRLLQKYFSLYGDNWKVQDEIRSMVQFRKFNLMQPFATLGKFDIIFCRNVAIYFTLEDRKELFRRIADSLTDDGYLIIGSTESLTGVCPSFVPNQCMNAIFYQKNRR